MAAARGGAAGSPGSEGYGVSRGEGDFTAAITSRPPRTLSPYLEKNNLLFTNDGQENIVDDYCALIAATELYADDEESRLQGGRGPAGGVARGDGWHAGDGRKSDGGFRRRRADQDYWRADGGDRPFFHPVDAGMPVVSLLDYAAVSAETPRERRRSRRSKGPSPSSSP